MTERPTDEQLAEWLYDAEFDPGAVDGDHDFDANPLPRNTFPHYYEDVYKPTLAVLFRELLELRAAAARVEAVAGPARTRIANLESGRVIEQEMLRNVVPRMSAALALHAGTEVPHRGVSPYCQVCHAAWPCDTWRALTGEEPTDGRP